MTGAKQITGRIFHRIRTTVAIGIWNPINLAGKRAETGLVGVRLAGQREGHHGASMKRVFKRDDSRPSGMSTRDLHRILYSLRAAIHEKSLLRGFSRRDLVHAFGET